MMLRSVGLWGLVQIEQDSGYLSLAVGALLIGVVTWIILSVNLALSSLEASGEVQVQEVMSPL